MVLRQNLIFLVSINEYYYFIIIYGVLVEMLYIIFYPMKHPSIGSFYFVTWLCKRQTP